MPQSVPPIFSLRVTPARLGIIGRLVALAAAAVCLVPLIIAARLTPNPTGLGTHIQLGFAPCPFDLYWGIPCPFCGMTTSWAWFVRGNLIASLWVQPMGTLLAWLAVMMFWCGLYVGLTGRGAHRLLQYAPSGYIMRGLLLAAALAWNWKIFIQLHHLDGWH